MSEREYEKRLEAEYNEYEKRLTAECQEQWKAMEKEKVTRGFYNLKTVSFRDADDGDFVQHVGTYENEEEYIMMVDGLWYRIVDSDTSELQIESINTNLACEFCTVHGNAFISEEEFLAHQNRYGKTE